MEKLIRIIFYLLGTGAIWYLSVLVLEYKSDAGKDE